MSARKLKSCVAHAAVAVVESLPSRRLLAAADLDLSFGKDGVAVDDSVRSIDVESVQTITDSAGRVVVAATRGSLDVQNPTSDLLLQRFNADGSIDRSFGTDGTTFVDLGGEEHLVSIAAAGEKLLLSALHYTPSLKSRVAVIRLNASGALDDSFHGDGAKSFSFGPHTGAKPFGVARLDDGRIIVAGSVIKNGSEIGQAVARLRSDGSFDNTFSGDGLAEVALGSDRVFYQADLHLRPNGSFIISGAMLIRRQQIVLGAIQIAPDGTLDAPFADGGVYQSSESVGGGYFGDDYRFSAPTTLATDGSLLLAGSLRYAYNSDDTPHVVRVIKLDRAGRPDATFGVDGQVVLPRGQEVIVGDIVATGTGIYLELSDSNHELIRLKSNGELDSEFADNGVAPLPNGGGDLTFGSMQADAAGRIVLAGRVDYSLRSIYFTAPIVSRITAGGALDESFGAAGFVTPSIAGRIGRFNSVVELANGKILAAGFTLGSGLDFLLRQYNADGSIDASFADAGSLLIDFGGAEQAWALAVQDDGKILVGGGGNFGVVSDFVMARVLPDGRLDPTFSGDGKVRTQARAGADERIVRIVPQADGSILAGGPSDVGSSIVRYRRNGSLDRAFGEDGVARIAPRSGERYMRIVDFGVNRDGSILLGANGAIGGGSTIVSLIKLTKSGAPDASFRRDGRVDVDQQPYYYARTFLSAFQLTQDGKALMLYEISPYAGRTLVRYNADGSEDLQFAPEFYLSRHQNPAAGGTLALTKGGKFVVTAGELIAKQNPNGSADRSFNGGVVIDTPVGSFRHGDTLVLSDGRILFAGEANRAPAVFALIGDSRGVFPFAEIQSGRLDIQGTAAADEIDVRRVDDEWTITLNGDAARFDAGDVSSIRIMAGRGGDRINAAVDVPTETFGEAGNDFISVSGNVNVLLEGGKDNDLLQSGGGNDTLIGGPGNDGLDGGFGADVLSGGEGLDTASYGSRTTAIVADDDNIADDGAAGERDNIQSNIEAIAGGKGNDRLTLSTTAEQTLIGGAGNDTLTAGNGSAHLDGGDGNDRLIGGDGDDAIDGGSGRNTLLGNGGDDNLFAGSDADDFSGGDGFDYLGYGGNVDLRIDLDNKANDGRAGERDNVRSDVENITGGSGNDWIRGSAANNWLVGGVGNDTLIGLAGDDRLIGDGQFEFFGGDDVLDGGDGNDHLHGGGHWVSRNQTYGSAFNGIRNRLGKDKLFGGAGDDYFAEYDYNDDTIDGGAGNDVARRDRDNHGANDTIINVERFLGIARFPDYDR